METLPNGSVKPYWKIHPVLAEHEAFCISTNSETKSDLYYVYDATHAAIGVQWSAEMFGMMPVSNIMELLAQHLNSIKAPVTLQRIVESVGVILDRDQAKPEMALRCAPTIKGMLDFQLEYGELDKATLHGELDKATLHKALNAMKAAIRESQEDKPKPRFDLGDSFAN